MAIKLLTVNDVYNIREAKYLVDTEAEKDGIPEQDKVQGTQVLVIEGSKRYRMNSAGEWVEMVQSGGGGGGSDLPDVTADDDGKVLGVVNGSWDKVDVPDSEPFVVNITMTTDTEGYSEETVGQILAAYNNGQRIVAKGNYDGNLVVCELTSFTNDSDTRYAFGFTGITEPSGVLVDILIPFQSISGNSVVVYYYPLFTNNLIEHDYTVTYADNTTATLKNVEVV